MMWLVKLTSGNPISSGMFEAGFAAEESEPPEGSSAGVGEELRGLPNRSVRPDDLLMVWLP